MNEAVVTGPSTEGLEKPPCRRRMTSVTTLVASASLISMGLQVGAEAIAASAGAVI
jgi:hypothetical protein